MSCAPAAPPRGTMRAPEPVARQFPTALAFALRNQARNRLAWMLLAGFVPTWYALMAALITHDPLDYRLFSTGATLGGDPRRLRRHGDRVRRARAAARRPRQGRPRGLLPDHHGRTRRHLPAEPG